MHHIGAPAADETMGDAAGSHTARRGQRGLPWGMLLKLLSGSAGPVVERGVGGSFNHAGGDGVAGEAGGVVDVELVHHGLAVFFDRLDADPELVGGLFVGVAFGDELEDFGLACGEGVKYC